MDRVTKEELPEVTAFLEQDMARAMFPLNNLRQFGLDGDHPYAPTIWAAREGGTVTGVLTIARNHTVMPNCAPEMALSVIRGRKLFRIVGNAAQSRPLVDALRLSERPNQLDQDEPHYALDLSDLIIPDGPGRLCPLQSGDRDEMIRWRTNYNVETLGGDPDEARTEGAEDYEGYLSGDSHRVLMDGDTALSTTGFNATLPEIVQIGGVYTPPALRRRGHARRAVALHLDEARRAGVTRATLFAANPHAARAYEAIGFRRIGDWMLFLLPEAVDV